MATPDAVRHNLRSKSVHGALYIAASGGGEAALRLVSASLLARLLIPADFGLIGMVTALTAMAGQVSQLGLSTVTVQRRDINPRQVTNLFWINVALGAGLSALFCALSPLIAAFYNDPRIIPITLALSSSFLIGGCTVQHEALLSRDMKQAQSAISRLGASFVSVCVAVSLAFAGYGYWALVCQELTRSLLIAAGVWFFCPWRPGRPCRDEDIRGLLRFGADLTFTQVFYAFLSGSDRLLVGKLFGASALGMYRQAQQLIMTPIDQLSGPIGNVMQPGLSILQDDPGRYRRYYEKTARLIGLASMPIAAAAALFAEEFTRVILGAKWYGAVPYMRIFAIAALIRPVMGTSGTVLITCGKSRKLLTSTLISQLTFVAFVLLGSDWGPQGVAMASVITPALLLLPILHYSFAGTPIPVGTFFRAIRTPAIATAVMSVGLLFYRSLGLGQGGHLFLGSVCVLGGLLYLGSCLAIPEGRREIRALLGDIGALLPRQCIAAGGLLHAMKRRIRYWLPAGPRVAVQVVRNTLMQWFRCSDYQRWTSSQNLQEWWDERTYLIAALVPETSRVIEFGAGRRQLETILPPGCSYVPSDLVDRGPGTLVCDLNVRPLPDLAPIRPEVAVFGGVLEYLHDVEEVVRWLAGSEVRMCIASFDPVPAGLSLAARMDEWKRRRESGYMCSFTEDDLLRAFVAAGFECVQKRPWMKQSIYLFRRQP